MFRILGNLDFVVFILPFLVILNSGIVFSSPSPTSRILQGPHRSGSSAWGSWEYCPEDNFVNGIWLKATTTGVYGVKMFCTPPISMSIKVPWSISSSVGNGGSWKPKVYCPRHQLLVGFQLKSDNQSTSLGVVKDFVGICEDGSVLSKSGRHDASENYNATSSAEWTPESACPENWAICGIRTQLQAQQITRSSRKDSSGSESQPGILNMNFECCEVTLKPECTFKEAQILVHSFDNRLATTPQREFYSLTTGVISETEDLTMTEVRESQKREGAIGLSTSIAAKIYGVILAKLEIMASFGGESTKAKYEMMMNRIKTTRIFIEKREKELIVPNGVKVDIYQTIYMCGDYAVRLNYETRNDTTVESSPPGLPNIQLLGNSNQTTSGVSSEPSRNEPTLSDLYKMIENIKETFENALRAQKEVLRKEMEELLIHCNCQKNITI